MGVGGDVAVVVLDQHEVAVTFQFVAAIADRAGGGGAHRGALRGGDVDAVVALTAAIAPIVQKDAAAYRPLELRPRSREPPVAIRLSFAALV